MPSEKKKLDQVVGNVVESLGVNGENNVIAQVQGVQPGVQGAAANADLEVINQSSITTFFR